MTESLNELAFLVTGGGSGMGLCTALRLAADGAAVTIVGRTEERLVRAEREIRTAVGPAAKVWHAVADVTDEEACAGAVAASLIPTGRLDGVVTYAGEPAGQLGPVTHLDVERWRYILEQNLTGTMVTLKYAARELVRGGGGSFVGISSLVAATTTRWTGPISATKSGIDQFLRVAASELGPSGVRVNCIRPGLIPVARQEVPQSVLDDFADCIPLPRRGAIEDVAALARFLLGPESSWITGQVVNVDGGQSLRRGFDARTWVEPEYSTEALRGVFGVAE